jgi:hypothetical protein
MGPKDGETSAGLGAPCDLLPGSEGGRTEAPPATKAGSLGSPSRPERAMLTGMTRARSHKLRLLVDALSRRIRAGEWPRGEWPTKAVRRLLRAIDAHLGTQERWPRDHASISPTHGH